MAQVDIARLRSRLGGDKPLSQSELAKKIGVDQASISRWERKIGAPTPSAKILLEQLDETAPQRRPRTHNREGATA